MPEIKTLDDLIKIMDEAVESKDMDRIIDAWDLFIGGYRWFID